MRIRDLLQQRFGFTRNEIVVVGLLSAGLLTGDCGPVLQGSRRSASAASRTQRRTVSSCAGRVRSTAMRAQHGYRRVPMRAASGR